MKKSLFKQSEWEGQILAFISNHLFQNIKYKSDNKNQFEASFVNIINRIT